jgi:uncharacterized protein YgiM (DUF1202 family)
MARQTVGSSVNSPKRVWTILAGAALCAGLLLVSRPARAQDAAGFAIGDAVVVDTDGLSLRSEPALTGDTVATLRDGTWATVTDGPTVVDGFTWYALDVDGQTGWSAGEFLAAASGDAGNLPAGTTVAVTTDQLNLRADAGLDFEATTTLATGALATVLAGPVESDGYVWYQLDSAGTTGWAVRDFLAFAAPDFDAAATGTSLVVNTDALSLRDAPGLTGGVVASLVGGTVVTVVAGPESADGLTWYEVASDFGSGWVAGEFFRLG